MRAARFVAQIGAREAQHDPADKTDQDRHWQADCVEPDGKPQMLPDQQLGGDRSCGDQLHQRRDGEAKTGEQGGFQRSSCQAGVAVACEQGDTTQSGECGDPDCQGKGDIHRLSVSVWPQRGGTRVANGYGRTIDTENSMK